MITNRFILLFALGISGLLFSGCLTNWSGRRTTQATSVVQFLYPSDFQHADAPGVPVLKLPLCVGVAFVPAAKINNAYASASGNLSEKAKADLLKRVSDEFRALPYVKSIEEIPTAYLRPGGGFENLDQIKLMFGIDVIALVSYDQVQLTHEGLLSLAYWTIVGAYIIPGEKNDTQTLMDTAVYDITSRKLLFRAPGTSQVKANSTAINQSEQRHLDSLRGFDEATRQLVANLQRELDRFKARVKESPEEFKIEHKPGYTGAGSLDAWFVTTIAGIALVGIARRSRVKTANLPLPWLTFAVAAIAFIVWHFPSLNSSLIYDRHQIVHGELWRLWSGHFVHFTQSHFLLDTGVLVAAAAWSELRHFQGMGRLLVLTPPVISLALLVFDPQLLVYAGLSGLATASVVFAACSEIERSPDYRWPWIALLALVVVKIASEFALGTTVFTTLDTGIRIAPISHAFGVLAAAVWWEHLHLSRLSNSG